MTDQTPAGRLRCFLAVEEAEGTGDDTQLIDGIDLTFGDLRDVLAEVERHRERLPRMTETINDLNAERNQLRRRLEAAEAQPCDHNSDAFEALERLHARIHRDFNFDAAEAAPPTEDEPALRMMDDLVAFADEVYMPLADAAAKPAPSVTAEQEPERPFGDALDLGEARDLARALWAALTEAADGYGEIIGYDPRLDYDGRLPYWLTNEPGAPQTWDRSGPDDDLTLRDIDPEAVYATEDDDFYEEAHEGLEDAEP